MPSHLNPTCEEAVFCRLLIAVADDARDGAAALGRRLLTAAGAMADAR